MSHPSSIRPPRARLVARIVVPVAILGTTAFLLVSASWRALERLPEARVTPVAVVQSSKHAGAGDGGMQAPGWIEPAPFATEVRALRAGVVTAVRTLEGAHVAAGDIIATLEHGTETIALARAEAGVRLADAEIQAKRAARDAATRAHDLALDAERAVRDAEALLVEADAMRAKLAADITEAEATEAEARDEHERKLKLVASGSVSEGDARRLGLRVEALAAKTESLRSERAAREARAIAARGNLDAARVARRELVAERRARDEASAALAGATAARDAALAARDEAQLALDRSDIRAPIAGTVMRRLAAPGARVGGEDDTLVLLYDPSSLQVRCDVPLKEAGKLAVGLDAEIRVDALPDRVFHGKVARIVPQGDIQKNTVQCKIAIDAPDAALTPDMLARVRIITRAAGGTAEAIAVPVDTLRSREGDRATVVVAVPDRGAARAATRTITLGGERANGWIEVTDGLAAGDRVIVDAAVRDGARLSPVETAKEEAP
jgi:RND family efflux transporter MFP subunit